MMLGVGADPSKRTLEDAWLYRVETLSLSPQLQPGD